MQIKAVGPYTVRLYAELGGTITDGDIVVVDLDRHSNGQLAYGIDDLCALARRLPPAGFQPSAEGAVTQEFFESFAGACGSARYLAFFLNTEVTVSATGSSWLTSIDAARHGAWIAGKAAVVEFERHRFEAFELGLSHKQEAERELERQDEQTRNAEGYFSARGGLRPPDWDSR